MDIANIDIVKNVLLERRLGNGMAAREAPARDIIPHWHDVGKDPVKGGK